MAMTSNELEQFKQSILDSVRVMMQTTGQVTQYVGARYEPLFADPIEWSDQMEYEPLTIVTHQGNSFTSRQFTPKGIGIDNAEFWASTGNYNAQIEQYRQEVAAFDKRIENNALAIKSETERAKKAEEDIAEIFKFNLKEYNPDATGLTDSSTAFQNAIDAAYTDFSDKTYNKVFIPSGKYLIENTVNLYPTVHLVFDSGCTIFVKTKTAFKLDYKEGQNQVTNVPYFGGDWVKGSGCCVFGTGVDDGFTFMEIGNRDTLKHTIAYYRISGFSIRNISKAFKIVMNNQYITWFDNMSIEIVGDIFTYIYESGFSNSGEKMTIENSLLAGSKRVFCTEGNQDRAVSIFINNCSVDYNSKIASANNISLYFNGCHIEHNYAFDDTNITDGAFTVTSGYLFFTNCEFYEDFTDHLYLDSEHVGVSFNNCHIASYWPIKNNFQAPFKTDKPISFNGVIIDDSYGYGFPANKESSIFNFDLIKKKTPNSLTTLKQVLNDYGAINYNEDTEIEVVNCDSTGLTLSPKKGSASFSVFMYVPNNARGVIAFIKTSTPPTAGSISCFDAYISINGERNLQKFVNGTSNTNYSVPITNDKMCCAYIKKSSSSPFTLVSVGVSFDVSNFKIEDIILIPIY